MPVAIGEFMVSIRNFHLRKKNKHITLKSVLAFLLSLLLCAVLIGFAIRNRQDIERMTMERLIIEKSISITEVVTKLLYKTHTLSSLVIQSNGEIWDFEKVASTIVDSPVIKNILVAPSGIITDVYPLHGNGLLIGYNMMDLRRDGNKEAMWAMEKKELVVAGPFTTVDDDQVIAGRLPVFLSGADGVRKFWGLVSVTLKFPKVLEGTGLETLDKQGFIYELWRVDHDSGDKQIIAQSGEVTSNNLRFIEEQIRIFNSTWYFRIAPVQEWYHYPDNWILILAGILVSLLIAAVVQNNCELNMMKTDLEGMVRTDPLTGVYNRKGLFHELEEAVRRSWPFKLHYLDLNYFKQINDTYGHNIGDLVLVTFCERIHKHLNANHIFARISGDEFVLVDTGPMPPEKDEAFWNAVYTEFDRPVYHDGSNGVLLDFSRGMAAFPEEAGDIDELISCADKRMYEEKNDRYASERRRRRSDWEPHTPMPEEQEQHVEHTPEPDCATEGDGLSCTLPEPCGSND